MIEGGGEERGERLEREKREEDRERKGGGRIERGTVPLPAVWCKVLQAVEHVCHIHARRCAYELIEWLIFLQSGNTQVAKREE